MGLYQNQDGLVIMKRNPNIPKFKEKLYIVCEGVGDKIYLDKIFSLYESKYDIKVIPSGGKNKIIDKLREVLILHPHNKCFIFVDTDTEGIKALENYKKQKLFYDIGHPNEAVIREICKNLLKLLGIDYNGEGKCSAMNEHELPIYPYIGNDLNLEFRDNYIRNKEEAKKIAEKMDLSEYIKEYILWRELSK